MTVVVSAASAIKDRPCHIAGRFTALTATGNTSPVSSEGDLIRQADVSSITCQVYGPTGSLINTYTPTAASNVYDTIQTAEEWENLTDGGNFLYTIPASAFPTAGVVNRAVVTITMTDGSLATGLWNIDVTSLTGISG